MRRSLRITSAFAVAVWMLAGCTLLIDFEDVPQTSDGGGGVDSSVVTPGQEAGKADAGVDAPADARDANPGFVTACEGKGNGKYCPGHMIDWPGAKDELVTCRDGGVAATRVCSAGSGCIFMIDGYPDECDQCATKTVTGTYCGRDMPGWDPKNANFRVRCQGGAQVGLLLCNGACTSNGANSTCP